MLVSISLLRYKMATLKYGYILSSCRHLQLFHQYLVIVIQVVVACIPILSEILWDDADCISFPDIGMLIMRVYALYERSRKVLALYIVVTAIIVVMGCVSLNFSGSVPNLIFHFSSCGI